MSEPQRACMMQACEETNTEASVLNTPNATPTRMSRTVPPATVTVGAANCTPIRVTVYGAGIRSGSQADLSHLAIQRSKPLLAALEPISRLEPDHQRWNRQAISPLMIRLFSIR